MKTILKWVGIAIGIILIFAAIEWYYRKRIEEYRTFGIQIERLDSVSARLERSAALKDTVFLKAVTVYRHTSDSVIREIFSVPGDSVSKTQAVGAVKAVQVSCDAVVAACDQRVATRDSLIDSLRRKAQLLARAPILPPPRWTLYGAGLYDFGARAYGGRTGLEYRIAGPVSAYIETSLVKRDSLQWRGSAGVQLRRNF